MDELYHMTREKVLSCSVKKTRKFKEKKQFFLGAFCALFILSFTPVYAACFNDEDGNPGQEGDIEYRTGSNILQYCDDTQWINMIDASDHTLTKLATLSTGSYYKNPRALAVSGDYVFSLAGGLVKSLISTDVSNPSSPTFVDQYQDSSNLTGPFKVILEGNYAYLVSSTNDSLVIVDISDPTNMSAPSGGAGGVLVDSTNLDDARDIAISGNYAFITSRNNHGIAVVDISDKASPTLETTLTDSNALNGMRLAEGIDIQGNYAYVVAFNSDTLSVIDISDPTSPSVVGVVDDGTDLNGALDVEVRGNYAYVVAQGADGVAVVDISNPATPTIVGAISDAANMNVPWEIALEGNYAYVTANTSDSLSIIDISDPALPTRVYTVSNSTFLDELNGVVIQDGLIYVSAYAHDSISIYRLQSDTGTACSNPGEYYYDFSTDAMVYCNGTTLFNMGDPASGSGACSPEGALNYNADRYEFCDGNGWVDIGK